MFQYLILVRRTDITLILLTTFKFTFSPLVPAAPKRELEDADGPAAKVPKTENGS